MKIKPRAMRYAFALSALAWMVAGVAAHNAGWQTISLVCSFLVYACVLGALTFWIWR